MSSKQSLMKLVKTNGKKGNTSITGKSETSNKGDNSAGQKQENGPVHLNGASECGQKLRTEMDSKLGTAATPPKDHPPTAKLGPVQPESSSALSMLGNYSESEESDT